MLTAAGIVGVGVAGRHRGSDLTAASRRIYRMAIDHAIPISFVVQLGLIAFGEYQDRYSGVKYTDIDYRVFSDAVRCLWTRCGQGENGMASGPVNRWFGGVIGE